MQTTNADRAAAIEISGVKLAKWKTMLKDRKIGTTKKLLSRVPEISGEPVARKALNGQRLDRPTWEAIFKGLKVHRADFFTDVEWFDRDLTAQWGLLWEMATDAADCPADRLRQRFGLVLPQVDDAPIGTDRFQQSIVSRTSVLIEIPWGTPGYLMLLERDALGNIVLLCPSPLMANPLLTGKVQRLPQYPPSPFEFFQPLTVGTNYLWAGIFEKLPELKWLAEAQKRPLRLQLSQLTDLFEYARKQPQDTPIWRSSYLVTTALDNPS
jgi:hypothetical protein